MKAIKILGHKRAKLSSTVPLPDLPVDGLLVKAMAVSLNPTDWKHIDFIPTKGATAGCDYAGIVEEIGPAVSQLGGNSWKVGDRVAGFTHGCNGENLSDGSFAEYIAVKAHINIRLPDWMSFEDGATLAVGITTVAQALYQELQLPLPSRDIPAMALGTSRGGKHILIYGGSTATGTLAIQFAKLSGYEVITTCSPNNFSLVRDRGADHVLDYRSPTLTSNIHVLTNGALHLVLDCITGGESTVKCCEALSPASPSKVNTELRYCGLFNLGALPRSDVRASFTLAYTALGESFQKWDNYYQGSREDAIFAGDFMSLTSGLLEMRMIKPHPAEVRPGGLAGVLNGLDSLREGDVSGKKLVYSIAS